MFASSGRAQLAYETTGAGAGVDVLLLHAGVNDRRSWQSVTALLAPRHRCVSFDMRGFGETRYQSEEGWSPVRDAVAVLDAAGVQRAAVVASSMGGQTAVDLTLAEPERVAGLVLIGTAIRGAPYPELSDGPTAELNARFEQAAAEGDLEELGRLDAEDPGSEQELPDAWPQLSSIAIPTLVLLGRLDSEEIVVIGEQAAELIPGARLRMLDGVAHVPHLEGDEETLSEIAMFVDQLD